MLTLDHCRIGVIGLGYVGLPLAVEFSKRFPVTGLDIDESRVETLKSGEDNTLELSNSELASAGQLIFTSQPAELKDCNIYIVTVPTPVSVHKQPDLQPLINASEMLGHLVDPGDIVIYESTVYPGATEEVCIPVIEQVSRLTYNKDFFAGYSPERINPGDREHRVTNILKVTSGSTAETAELVDELYRSIITAGTHRASSIRVAEASKVIENTQRDVNIALMNELALIFDKLGIDTTEVLEAAGTKWNFLPFRPGLVGGHCIGVDPYYLTHKAQEAGYQPSIIPASRVINEGMAEFIAAKLVKLMAAKSLSVSGARVLVLGFSFKENCPDLRNTKVIDIIHVLNEYRISVDVHDPWIDKQATQKEYGEDAFNLVDQPETGSYDAVLLAVAHRQFCDMGAQNISALTHEQGIIYDLKACLAINESDARL
jgi:UDP-N-acetyl-D-galactosamine dehydrogenase